MDHSIKIFVLSAMAALSPMLAACTPDTPETQLSWNANDRLGRRPAAHAPTVKYAGRDTAKTYVYQGDSYAVPAPKPRPAPPPYRPAAYQPSATPTYSKADAVFAWPVSGPVIASFGTTNNGERNDGINIATAMGTPIHASASGTVTYAGNELRGYGNLLLLKHPNGYVTAYAHADRLIVARGEFVAKNQVIGYSGATGDVSSPQLHFEIRRDTTPVNPRNLLVARNS